MRFERPKKKKFWHGFDTGPLRPRSAGHWQAQDYGPCCACGVSNALVRNFVTLDAETPIRGSGWGCFACGLPPNGAMAVVCDQCLEKGIVITEYIYGAAPSHDRRPVAELGSDFDHDLTKHPELPEGRQN